MCSLFKIVRDYMAVITIVISLCPDINFAQKASPPKKK